MSSVCQLLHFGAYLALLLMHTEAVKRRMPPRCHHMLVCTCYGLLTAAAAAEPVAEYAA